MWTILKIAWRNLWRNKRRTLITTASVFFAVLLALVMRSMQLGSYDNMIKNAVSFYTGYIQVHEKGYWEDKSINLTFEYTENVEDEIKTEPGITSVIPRLESFALASSGNYTKGSAIIGTDPKKEAEFTQLDKNVVKGEYLKQDDKGVLIASKLADYLKLDIGDSIVLFGQGYHGITAAGEYPVRGILNFPNPEMNKQTIYMSLSEAQYLYGAQNKLSSLAIMIEDPDELQLRVQDLKNKLGDEYEVMDWKEMMPELLQEIQADNIGGLVMLGILYVIIAFGILGTVIMMSMERKREFAVMIAVGMRKGKLLLMLFFETIIIGLIGVISGVIAGFPINLYFHHNPIPLGGELAEAVEQFNVEPIIPFSMDPSYFINQGIVVVIMTLLAFIFPLVFIIRFNLIKGMRN
ncbi:MAG: FtsX-like permease family protein [Bacteroidota bacterium]|nr:FtsX-like permease family protein [Bacteroidota bacterium]